MRIALVHDRIQHAHTDSHRIMAGDVLEYLFATDVERVHATFPGHVDHKGGRSLRMFTMREMAEGGKIGCPERAVAPYA